MRTAAGMPGRTDDYRDAGLESLTQDEPEISFHAFARSTRFAGAQIVRTRVCGARIAANEARSLFHGANQTLFPEPCAEIARSSDSSYLCLCLRHRFINNRQTIQVCRTIACFNDRKAK